MAIITISRGCFSHGQKIAEKVAEILGYHCVSREILIDAAQLFNISEQKLIKSIHDAPTILERLTGGKTKYLNRVQTVLLEYVKQDDVVYHGHAGHLLLTELPKVLKVRIMAELEDRVALLQQRENLSRNQALSFIEREDKHRNDWTRYLYNADINDPQLYDMVLKIGILKIEDACDLICRAAQKLTHRTVPEDLLAVSDMALANRIHVALEGICEGAVKVKDGVAYINVSAPKIRKTGQASPALQMHIFTTIKEDLTRQILEATRNISGIKDVVIDVDLPYYS